MRLLRLVVMVSPFPRDLPAMGIASGSWRPSPVRRRGFTLMETVLVVAVGIGLLTGGIVLYDHARKNADYNDRTRTYVAISAEVRALYRGARNFNGLTDVSFKARSTLPEHMFHDMAVRSMGAPHDLFMITSYEIDPKTCLRIHSHADVLFLGMSHMSIPETCEAKYLAIVFRKS